MLLNGTTTAQRLEIQLLSTNVWTQLCDEPSASPLLAFIQLITRGSSRLDAILLRATCPYLFGIWSAPIFSVSLSARLPVVVAKEEIPAAHLLQCLDENLLALVFSFLSEEDLARSVSLVCTLFRASIFSTQHVNALLGKTMSSSLPQVLAHFARGKRDAGSADMLANRLLALHATLHTAQSILRMDSDPVVNGTAMDLFHQVPDCLIRLEKLAMGLTLRETLFGVQRELTNLIEQCRALLDEHSQAHRALVRMLAACATFGREFGTPRHEGDTVAFPLSALTRLHEIKSRFHRKFTASEAVLMLFPHDVAVSELEALVLALHTIKGGTSRQSAHQIIDAAASICHKLRAMQEQQVEGFDGDNFHTRVNHLLALFNAQRQDLMRKIGLAQQLLPNVLAFLVPMRGGATPAVVQTEIAALFDFTSFCLARLGCSSNNTGETSQALRDYAWACTALEASAVARSASQRAFKVKLQPEEERSPGFLMARNRVQGVLSSEVAAQEAKLAREARMQQVLEQSSLLLSPEERASRKDALHKGLVLRTMPSLPREALPRPDVRKHVDKPLREQSVKEESARQLPTAAVAPNAHALSKEQGLLLWNWSAFNVDCMTNQDIIWHRVANLTPPPAFAEDELARLHKLFSRGPEVHLTVGAAHQKLVHFTAQDFAGVSGLGRNNERNLVDLKRSQHALSALLPQVQPQQQPLTAAAPPPAMPASKQGLILPLARILALKRESKLNTAQLNVQHLEQHLSEEEFVECFRMTTEAFYSLPAWKRDKAKKDAGLF